MAGNEEGAEDAGDQEGELQDAGLEPTAAGGFQLEMVFELFLLCYFCLICLMNCCLIDSDIIVVSYCCCCLIEMLFDLQTESLGPCC